MLTTGTAAGGIRRGRVIALALSAAAYAGPGEAGPCTAEIGRVQVELDARIDAEAGQGRSARENTSALLHHQPTPESILKVEENLGEGRASQAAMAALAHARVADVAGDARGC